MLMEREYARTRQSLRKAGWNEDRNRVKAGKGDVRRRRSPCLHLLHTRLLASSSTLSPHNHPPPQPEKRPTMRSHLSLSKDAEANAAASFAARGALIGATKWGLATFCLGALSYGLSPIYRGLTFQFKV